MEHLQTVLKEFDPTTALNKAVLICHFCDGLRPSIWPQSEKQGRELDTWDTAIKKTIDEVAKTA